MIIHDVEQGSPEWYAARLGIPTASEFSKIITPLGAESKSADGYADELIAEIIAGEDVDGFDGTKWTERGKALEQEAADWYEFRYDVDVAKSGFITDDARTMGCSLDRTVGDDGVVEIKCLAGKTMVKLLLKGDVEREHYPQIQGQLLISGRKWCDQVLFHPKMPKIVTRIERDEPYIFSMKKYLATFRDIMAMKRKTLIKLGHMENV